MFVPQPAWGQTASYQWELNRLSTLQEAEKGEKNLTNNQQKEKACLESEDQSNACQQEVKPPKEQLREKKSKILELNKKMESLSTGQTENLQKWDAKMQRAGEEPEKGGDRKTGRVEGGFGGAKQEK